MTLDVDAPSTGAAGESRSDLSRPAQTAMASRNGVVGRPISLERSPDVTCSSPLATPASASAYTEAACSGTPKPINAELYSPVKRYW